MAHSVEEATFDIQPYKLHLLEEGPKTTTTLTRTEALEYYRYVYRMLIYGHSKESANKLVKRCSESHFGQGQNGIRLEPLGVIYHAPCKVQIQWET